MTVRKRTQCFASWPYCSSRKHRNQGFSLIELLGAMAVLLIMMVILGSILTMITKSTSLAMARVDNFGKARLALQIISRDLEESILRRDLANFRDSSGGVDFAFYTKRSGLVSPSALGNRGVSLVRYDVDFSPSDDLLQRGLRRMVAGFDYATSLGFAPSPLQTPISAAAYQTQVIGPGVIACGLRFIRKDGSLYELTNGGFDFYDYDDPSEPTNCFGMVVSLLVLDERSLERLGQPGVDRITSIITGTPSDGISDSYKTFWEQQMEASNFYDTFITKGSGEIRIHERTVFLPLPKI